MKKIYTASSLTKCFVKKHMAATQYLIFNNYVKNAPTTDLVLARLQFKTIKSFKVLLHSF